MALEQIVYFGVLGAVAAFSLWRDRLRRARRTLRRTPRKRLVETQDGERVVVSGVVAAVGENLRSPLTGRPCVGYRFTVMEDSSRGLQLDSCTRFVINADGAEAHVQGAVLLGFETTSLVAADCPGLEHLLRDRGARSVRCAEALLRVGDVVSVVGVVSVEVDQAGRRESARGQPIRRTIRGREKDPVIVGPAT